ncbi:ABC transporter permease [Bacillus sp. Marseille-Q3570]|uniref:ABC transporter permease subunit n=1 Tax=Bacillus sp. Marseille-Q3570 TaxID=2963522 RepID=UPI0021B70E3E|nr:ABC transporter permease [Bacillus sp. Marseille-Q3570]
MRLFVELGKSLLVNVFVLLTLILIVLFPRDLSIVDRGATLGIDMEFEYHFQFEEYKENIVGYLEKVFIDGNLGESLTGVPVGELIVEYVPRSLLVISSAFILCILIGVLKGIYDYRASLKKHRILGQGFTSLLLSIPDFFLIICLQWVVIFYIPWIDFYGYEQWYSFILPSILVSIYPMMYIARITSVAISNEEFEPYIQVARAKGFTRKTVLYKHTLKNCWGTILSHFSSVMLYILSNLLIVEYLLDYKGAAYRLFKAFHYTNSISAGYQADFEAELIIGLSVCFMLVVLFSQWISKITKYYVDPR